MIRTFLSFVEEDLVMVNLFRGQAKNTNSDLEFADYSVKEPYNSVNSDYIRGQIVPKISGSSLTICLFGPTTYSSSWVEWELKKAISLGKPVLGVSLYSDGRTRFYPSALQGFPILPWNVDMIVKTMRQLVS